MSHPLFENVLTQNWASELSLNTNLSKFTEAIILWNKETFGNIFHRKRRVEARLAGIQKALADGPNAHLLALERVLREKYWVINQQEEDFWSVKSRYNWLIQGDRNTNFFHTSALIRRKRNRIFCFKDNSGDVIYNEEAIAATIREGYISLFTTSKD